METKKKHRFYFSKKQQKVHDDFEGSQHRTYVRKGGKWVEYTEWCSSPEYDSNWDDAKLVFETDEKPEIKVKGELRDTLAKHLDIYGYLYDED